MFVSIQYVGGLDKALDLKLVALAEQHETTAEGGGCLLRAPFVRDLSFGPFEGETTAERFREEAERLVRVHQGTELVN